MKNPSILFVAPCVAELVDREMPVIGENEVLVRSVRSTISSGTERANLIGDTNVGFDIPPQAVAKFPRHMGYSASGVVVAVGSQITSVRVGDRVACADSKHALYFKVKEKRVFPLGEDLSFETGALTRIATFPMAAIRKCHLEIGEPAIVMGLGVLGQIAVQILRAAGAAPVLAVDPIESQRKKALALGADYALDPFAEGFAARVKELTGGGAKVAIEVTGKGQGLDMVLDCMAGMGRVALLGCTRDSDFTIDYYRKVHGPGISLIGAHTAARPNQESSAGLWTEKDDAMAILKLVRYGRLELDALLEETHFPSAAAEIFGRLAKGGAFPVVQFDWTELWEEET